MYVKRIIASVLASLMLVSVMASCSDEAGKSAETSVSAENADTAAESTAAETEPPLSDGLPDTKYNGRAYRIAGVEGYTDEFYAEEQTGMVENDSVYDRNVALEERFDISIQVTGMSGKSEAIYKALVQYVLAGDDFCEVASQEVWNLSVATAAGIYQNWNDTKYINLEQPWWNKQINENATFNKKLFALSGSYTVSYMKEILVMYVNTELLNGYGIAQDDLYDLVEKGGWTLDYLNTVTTGMYKDLNGDGVADDGDQYGFGGNKYYSDSWCPAFDIPITGKAEDGSLEIKLMQEKTYNALEKIFNLYYQNPGVHFYNKWGGFMEFFPIDKLVFAQGRLHDAFNELRNMDSPFGVIPQPKYDENQKDYHCLVMDGYFVLGIPTTAKDTDFISMITEALAAETYLSVYPAYYDIALKAKYSQDKATASMIDRITASAVFDVSFMYGTYLEELPYMFRDCLNKQTTDIASKYASVKTQIEAALQQIYAMYK